MRGKTFAAWVSNVRFALIPKQERRQFPRAVPEFVVEVMSPERSASGGTGKNASLDRKRRAGSRPMGKASRAKGRIEGFLLPLEEIREGL